MLANVSPRDSVVSVDWLVREFRFIEGIVGSGFEIHRLLVVVCCRVICLTGLAIYLQVYLRFPLIFPHSPLCYSRSSLDSPSIREDRPATHIIVVANGSKFFYFEFFLES